MALKNCDLYQHLRYTDTNIEKNTPTKDKLYSFVISKQGNLSSEQQDNIRSKVNLYVAHLYNRWVSANRTKSTFEKKYKEWLKLEFKLLADTPAPGLSKKRKSESEPKSRGRPKKAFTEASERSQRRIVSAKANLITTPVVVAVAKHKLQKKGCRTESRLISNVIETHERAKKIKKKLFDDNGINPYTAEEALAFLLDNNLTRKQYICIRLGAKERGADIYPPYGLVKKAKKRCYPDSRNTTEIGSRIPIQDLVDHTSSRIQKMLYETRNISLNGEYEVTYKWGMDGTSDQALYRQKFQTIQDAKEVAETSLIVASMVPLQLEKLSEDNREMIWHNSQYSSPRFCRPILFKFEKETQEITRNYVESINNEISLLQPTTLIDNVSIKHKFILCMIDGKTCTAITEVSTQRCQICGSPPKQMNDLTKADVLGNPDSAGFGISVLHTNIRCFECLIHVAYRLQVQKWRVSDKSDKVILERTKLQIQERFKNEIGILVDIVLQGKGTTNDGNTARRFFDNYTKSAEITGIDVDLVMRFRNILCAINSGRAINVESFRTYTLETARKYISLYSWYYLPAHVHKLLFHAAEIIRETLIPIGQLSEEAAEATNKFVRKFRREHTRKDSRLHTNEDLMNMLLAASDPYISTIRTKHVKNVKLLPEEVLNLLDLTQQEKEEIFALRQKKKEKEEQKKAKEEQQKEKKAEDETKNKEEAVEKEKEKNEDEEGDETDDEDSEEDDDSEDEDDDEDDDEYDDDDYEDNYEDKESTTPTKEESD